LVQAMKQLALALTQLIAEHVLLLVSIQEHI
jgi:hypothetical protein